MDFNSFAHSHCDRFVTVSQLSLNILFKVPSKKQPFYRTGKPLLDVGTNHFSNILVNYGNGG